MSSSSASAEGTATSSEARRSDTKAIAAPSQPASSKTSATKAPPIELTAVSPTVFVYQPPVGAKPTHAANSDEILAPIRPRSAETTPRLILVMGWMNAPLRLVTKYAAPYSLLFPQATIVVQLSTGVTFIRDKKQHALGFQHILHLLTEVRNRRDARSELRDQVSALESATSQAGLRLDADAQRTLGDEARDAPKEESTSSGAASSATDSPSSNDGTTKRDSSSNTPHSGGILIHSFSDGGAFNVSQLLKQVKGHDAPPALAHIMDSSPGRASPYSGSTAITLPLAKRPWVRAIVRSVLYIYLFVLYRFKSLMGIKTWSIALRARLNSPQDWTWTSTPMTPKGAGSSEKPAAAAAAAAVGAVGSGSTHPSLPPRCYLYSMSDALIDYRAVEDHAQEAARRQGQAQPEQVLDLPPRKGTAGDPQRQVVALRRWDGVQHCDIGRADFEGYWTAVRRFLETVL